MSQSSLDRSDANILSILNKFHLGIFGYSHLNPLVSCLSDLAIDNSSMRELTYLLVPKYTEPFNQSRLDQCPGSLTIVYQDAYKRSINLFTK